MPRSRTGTRSGATARSLSEAYCFLADCGTQRQPTPADVALALDIPEATARRAMEWIEQPISLDYAVGEDGEATIGDFVAAADNTEADASAAVLRDEVRRLVASIADESAPGASSCCASGWRAASR